MEFKKIKPREKFENENQTDYEYYLRNFYYNLNPPKPMNRYDFSYQNDLVDSDEIMDGKSGEYIKYLECYYNKYYYKLSKKVNYALYKSNKKANRDLYKSNKSKEKSNLTNKVTKIKDNLQERKESLLKKLELVKAFFKPTNSVIKTLSLLLIGVSAILLVTSILTMSHNLAFGILGTVVSLASASIAGTINYSIQKENNKLVGSNKKEKMPLLTKIKKQLKTKTKSLGLLTKKQRNRSKVEQNSDINLEMFKFDLDGVEEKYKQEEEFTFDFDLNQLSTTDENTYDFLDLFNFDLNKKEYVEPSKVKVIKR